jgi:hypothetical protein
VVPMANTTSNGGLPSADIRRTASGGNISPNSTTAGG